MKKTSVPKRKHFWKKLMYLKEKKSKIKYEQLLKKNTSLPKRKYFWKTLLYCQNKVKWLLKNTSVHLKENTFDKTSVLKRKHFWKRKKVQNEVKTLLKRTSVPKRKKVQVNYEKRLKKTYIPKRKCFWKKLILHCQNEVKLLLKNTSVSKRKQFWKRLLYLKERKNSTSRKMTSEKYFCT